MLNKTTYLYIFNHKYSTIDYKLMYVIIHSVKS